MPSKNADLTLASEPLVDLWLPSNDPRLGYFFELPSDTTVETYAGATPGTAAASVQEQVSNLSLKFFEDRSILDFFIISYWEVEFLIAEAALNGWISNNAQTHYETAVTSVIEHWGLVVPDDFLQRENVMWNSTMERLVAQKWSSLFFVNQIEAWAEFRRTGMPNLFLPNDVNGGNVPSRFLYPQEEQSLNSANYTTASQGIGGDNINANHIYQ